MKWGLVPHWSKHEDKTLSTTNARMENLAGIEGGTMWNSIKGKTRCAVICEGCPFIFCSTVYAAAHGFGRYFEWLKKGKDRLPFFTKYKEAGKPMLLAGLYDCVVLEGQTKPLYTFTIVTTDASKEFNWLHDRQPVILSTRKALDTWLDTSSQSWTPELTGIVQSYRDGAHPLEW
jgi:putative SOS response-associated peptidase YedK